MNINILRYSLFGIAGGQEVDHSFCQLYFIFHKSQIPVMINRSKIFKSSE